MASVTSGDITPGEAADLSKMIAGIAFTASLVTASSCTAEIRTRSERESEMLRVVLNAWVTKTTAAEILADPATRRRQVTMTVSKTSFSM